MSHTIYDIAKAAGVSIATVSRVFNKAESVKPSTREKVMKVADRLGYQPHVYAQGLASKRKNRIMMLAPVMSNYFLTEILRGIQDCLASHDIELNIVNISQDSRAIDQVENIIKKSWAEGYLLVSLHLNEEELSCLERYQVPISLLDDYSSYFDSVSFDNVEGAFLATDYLISRGYERIVILSANPNAIPIRERLAGYKKALEKSKIPFRESYVVTGDNMERDGFNEQSGYEAMRKILTMDPMPDAVFCTSDIKAVGAQKAMRETGLKIPLISFDNLSISEYIGLSTVSQPMYRMGSEATEMLISRIRNGESKSRHTQYEPELVIRSSSEKPTVKHEAV
ncbi:LacI family DNA-binding transcriptional regulator [Rhodohalobacter mucosus]|uniref:LacI family transcriptional regulator n=1 Tax=Rhodohalobacter mucosus TaxID=2079485 RepID=A0A316TVY5_9BACT|nr:LacI family DNA-binding transcriptional regulator [Rhodohalobacter mucosus]PWN06684.1 LacI family transcriptional regulator [Rhodohalobacter mucosus]